MSYHAGLYCYFLTRLLRGFYVLLLMLGLSPWDMELQPLTNVLSTPKSQDFYKNVLTLLTNKKISLMIGGTYALYYYTGILRPTKDLDLFCLEEDYPKIL